jgi:hypothetical protein
MGEPFQIAHGATSRLREGERTTGFDTRASEDRWRADQCSVDPATMADATLMMFSFLVRVN